MPTKTFNGHAKWSRLRGEARQEIRAQFARLYVEQHKTIRDIVTLSGRAYGTVHALLTEAGVLRPRGGAHDRKTTPRRHGKG